MENELEQLGQPSTPNSSASASTWTSWWTGKAHVDPSHPGASRMGHRDVSTTITCLYVLQRGAGGGRSPADSVLRGGVLSD